MFAAKPTSPKTVTPGKPFTGCISLRNCFLCFALPPFANAERRNFFDCTEMVYNESFFPFIQAQGIRTEKGNRGRAVRAPFLLRHRIRVPASQKAQRPAAGHAKAEKESGLSRSRGAVLSMETQRERHFSLSLIFLSGSGHNGLRFFSSSPERVDGAGRNPSNYTAPALTARAAAPRLLRPTSRRRWNLAGRRRCEASPRKDTTELADARARITVSGHGRQLIKTVRQDRYAAASSGCSLGRKAHTPTCCLTEACRRLEEGSLDETVTKYLVERDARMHYGQKRRLWRALV
ncbi:hypothetical protein MRX96_030834 [Rhipicephalus microplus]